mgnify:CR=1 FL=1
MAIDIIVPAAGESVTSANIAQWHIASGDLVKKGDILVTLDTDKVSTELEAEVSGEVTITVPEGEEIDIGAVIGSIEEKEVADTPEPAAEAPAPAEKEEEAKPEPKAAPAPTPKPTPVLAPVDNTPSTVEGRTSRKKMTPLRRKIATHLVNAQRNAALLTTFNEVDMAPIMELRKEVQDQFVAKHGTKLGFMSFFTKAVVEALKTVPSINAQIEGDEVVQNHFFDIGVAVGTEKGLVVPVIRDCEKKSFAEIELSILDYAQKARDGKIGIQDLQGGVFTISNGGVYGSLLSTPIVNPPQSAILGMHTIQQRPVAKDGRVEIAPMMYLALSYDHRLVDGKEAVTFLIKIKECLENPALLMWKDSQ